MNKKPKVEQIFILLALLTGCFMLIALPGCRTTAVGDKGRLYTCGDNDCISTGVTCGLVGGAPLWACYKYEGCLRYFTGCERDDDGKTTTALGLGCGESTGCWVGGSSCDAIDWGLSCGGCVIGDYLFRER